MDRRPAERSMSKRAAYPQCPDCQYNLTGLPTDSRCPECGTAIDWYVAWRRLPKFRLSKITLSVLLLGTLAAIAVQVFICSGGDAWLAIVGTCNGSTMDHVFRGIYNSISLIQATGAFASALLIAVIRCPNPLLGRIGSVLTTFATCASFGGVFARSFLAYRDRGTQLLLDFSLALFCTAVYYVTRRTISEWLAERDKRVIWPVCEHRPTPPENSAYD